MPNPPNSITKEIIFRNQSSITFLIDFKQASYFFSVFQMFSVLSTEANSYPTIGYNVCVCVCVCVSIDMQKTKE